MDSMRISLLFLFLYGFACAGSNNPITSLFGKSHEEKSETEDKAGTTTTTTAKPAGDTVTTADPHSMCGGLKGFLHMCKTEPTEPPKNVKTRNAPEGESDSSSDEDDDNDDDDDDNDSDDESKEIKPDTEKKEKEVEEGEGEDEVKEEAEKAKIEKREAAATAGPPPVGDPYVPPEIAVEAVVAKREAEDSSSEEESWEEEAEGRGRRECRDGEGKDCRRRRRRREFVPELRPIVVRTTTAAAQNQSTQD